MTAHDPDPVLEQLATVENRRGEQVLEHGDEVLGEIPFDLLGSAGTAPEEFVVVLGVPGEGGGTKPTGLRGDAPARRRRNGTTAGLEWRQTAGFAGQLLVHPALGGRARVEGTLAPPGRVSLVGDAGEVRVGALADAPGCGPTHHATSRILKSWRMNLISSTWWATRVRGALEFGAPHRQLLAGLGQVALGAAAPGELGCRVGAQGVEQSGGDQIGDGVAGPSVLILLGVWELALTLVATERVLGLAAECGSVGPK